MKDPKRLERYQRWKAAFGGPEGQEILKDLLRMVRMEDTSLVLSIVDGKVDPFYTIYNDGRRSLVTDIIKTLTEPPDLPEDDVEED